ncbi:hypothetical protein ACFY3U_08615 [Micromonospora sp. NPDC000089]|uniref:hypothetical protein n=1 Tax=unclassified Micromonospora TaxID=2617518 RepID=UPI0036829DD6
MQLARFVFLAMLPSTGSAGVSDAGVVWMLVSPNNRALGRGYGMHDSYAACRNAVLALREDHLRCHPLVSNVDRTGQWSWRVDLDDRPVAVSSRSYLRTRECSYNLERFLEALPAAEVVAGARTVRRGRWHGGAPEGDPPKAQLPPVSRAPARDLGGPADVRRNALR